MVQAVEIFYIIVYIIKLKNNQIKNKKQLDGLNRSVEFLRKRLMTKRRVEKEKMKLLNR